MSKVKQIYSIYCPDIEDYPYLPFFARNNDEAVVKFTQFCLDRQKICANPELHLIGKCLFDKNGDEYGIVPLMYSYKIDLSSKKSISLMRKAEFMYKVQLNLLLLCNDFKNTVKRSIENVLTYINKFGDKDF